MKPDEIVVRRAAVARGSYDPEAGTFTAVAATSNPVRRGAGGYSVDEVLSLDPAAVRLDRLQSGRAPLLDSHFAGSISDQIGVVTAARIDRGQLLVDVKLSDRADDRMNQIRADLASGILKNVSVGYRVYASKEVASARDGVPTILRTDWQPVEVSLVAIPADDQSYIRGLSIKGVNMDPETTSTEHGAAPALAPAAPALSAAPTCAQRAMSETDVCEATRIAANAGLDAAFVQRSIDGGVSLADFRTLVLNRRAEEAERTHVSAIQPGGDQTLDNPDFLNRAVGDALYARMTGKAPQGAAREIMGRSLLDYGAMLLQSRGERVSWGSRERLASQILTRTASTSDFPTLLTSAGHRVLVDAYQAAACPLRQLARRRDAADFRAISMVKLSEAPQLLEVKEGGEVKYGARAEAKEGFALKTYARIFSLSRNAIINDDLGAFADSSAAFGRSAAETEAGLLAGLLTANAGAGVNLDDGTPLYTAARGNMAAAGTAIDVTNLGLARKAMRDVKGLDGKTPLNVVPAHLVVGTAKETEAEQVLAQLYPHVVGDVNPFTNRVQLHVEPRLAGNAWRMFADPAAVPTIIIGYLNGADGPLMETREGWETLGFEFRAILDVGAGIQDWRGSYLNPGN
jgi:hypothetical protein